jgi:hypothetical protein
MLRPGASARAVKLKGFAFMNVNLAMRGMLLVAAAFAGVATAADLTIPKTVKLPDIDPLLPLCSDPAADRFLEIDISHRAPAGATRVQRISAWVTPDGVFHWPFVMRVRNIGDKPFAGKKGLQSVVVTEDDLITGKKGRVVAKVPFDRIAPRSGVAARFEFTAPAATVESGRFRRVYTLTIKYDKMDHALLNGPYGDCDLQNNTFAVEFNGSRKGWIFAK